MKTNKEDLLKQRDYSKKYREKHLDKDKKFFSVRFNMDEGNKIKEFMKKTGIPIKKIIDKGTEIMWGEINDKN